MSWSSMSVSSRGWASWESTRGGTFGGAPPSSKRPPHSLAMPRHPLAISHRRNGGYPVDRSPAPVAIHDGSIDPVMLKAGRIAEHRAESHSTRYCWRYVKRALVDSGGVDSYPQTTYAREAGRELVHDYGFVRLPIHSAVAAPVGSVIVYGGGGAGHVELRTPRGYVSDFWHNRPARMPFIGAYTRLERRPKQPHTAGLDSANSEPESATD